MLYKILYVVCLLFLQYLCENGFFDQFVIFGNAQR